jgi:hypothetical protein
MEIRSLAFILLSPRNTINPQVTTSVQPLSMLLSGICGLAWEGKLVQSYTYWIKHKGRSTVKFQPTSLSSRKKQKLLQKGSVET